MANFTQTITNSVRCFGNAPSTKWGQANFPYTMTFGSSKWGEGTATVPLRIAKLIENSAPVAFSFTTSVADFIRVIDIGSAVAGFENSGEELAEGPWKHVFTSDTSEAEDRAFASWTTAARVAASFTCLAAGGTSWSET